MQSTMGRIRRFLTNPRESLIRARQLCVGRRGIAVGALTAIAIMLVGLVVRYAGLREASWFILATGPLVGMVGMFLLTSDAGAREKVIAIGFGYLSLDFFFGCVHYYVYRHYPISYTVSASITQSKAYEEFGKSFDELLAINTDLSRLAFLDAHVEQGLEAAQNKEVILTGKPQQGKTIQIDEQHSVRVLEAWESPVRSSLQGGAGSGSVNVLIEIRDAKGVTSLRGGSNLALMINPSERKQTLAVNHMANAKDVDEFRSALVELITVYRLNQQERLDDLQKNLLGAADWTFLDFWYFSTVIFTTLGFGDIVPNSTLVRFLVMSQSILGVLYITFALSFVWPEIRASIQRAPDQPVTSSAGSTSIDYSI